MTFKKQRLKYSFTNTIKKPFILNQSKLKPTEIHSRVIEKLKKI